MFYQRNENLELNVMNQYTKKQLEKLVSNMSFEQNQKVNDDQSLLFWELIKARDQYQEDQKCLESEKNATRMLEDNKPNTEKNILSYIQDSLDLQEFINESTKSKNTDTDTDLDSYLELISLDSDLPTTWTNRTMNQTN